MTRLEALQQIVAKIDPDKASVIEPLLTEICFMEQRLTELRALPHLRVSTKRNDVQQITAAGKQYKETMQAYLNAVKVVQMSLSRFSVEERDAFDEWLAQNE